MLVIEVTNAREVVRQRIGRLGSRLIGKVVDAEAQVEKALMQEMETAFRDFGIEARIYSVDGPAMVGRSHLELPIQVREGRFDVLVVAGPGTRRWPGLGVRALTTLCSEMGLSVGVFGGEGLRAKGALPLPGTGAVAIVEDSQGRIHRVEGRALVRVVEPTAFPDPFEGWLSPALLPLETALELRRQPETV